MGTRGEFPPPPRPKYINKLPTKVGKKFPPRHTTSVLLVATLYRVKCWFMVSKFYKSRWKCRLKNDTTATHFDIIYLNFHPETVVSDIGKSCENLFNVGFERKKVTGRAYHVWLSHCYRKALLSTVNFWWKLKTNPDKQTNTVRLLY